jgi:bifunctional ADP-heptose synthase (sugar kinase/adenylyltransferase)
VTRVRLTVLGDALLDRDVEGDVHRLAPDAPVPVLDGIEEHARAGGAGLAARIAAAGWTDVAWRDLVGGAVALHRARRP